jgi:putative DNA primase/helicase
VLRAALVYASWGWHVHPLRPGDKRPLLNNWPQRASTESAQIRRWWARWPEANIGLACGPSGFVAIDLDVKGGVDGLASWAALKAELGIGEGAIALRTPVSNTPSGGRHVLFAVPEGRAAPRNTAGKLGPGIDIRGDGGYIVLPPSRLATEGSPGERGSAHAECRSATETAAGTWTWRPEAHPRDCRPQPVPPALWERLRGVPARLDGPTGSGSGRPPDLRRLDPLAGVTAYAKAALQYEARRVATARRGTRNDTLNTAAFSLGQLVAAGLLHNVLVERPLLLAARVAGLGPEEAMATIHSGLEAGQARPRARLPVLTEPGPTRAQSHPQQEPVGPAVSEARPHPGRVQPDQARPPAQAGALTAAHPAVETAPDGASCLLALPLDDEGNAQCVVRLHGDRFLYCPAFGWKQYVGTHWAPDPEGLDLGAAIIEVLKARHRLALEAERTDLARATTRSNHRVKAMRAVLAVLLSADVASFDASPDHLNVANGVLDLRTGDLLPHEPDQRFSYCLEAAYEPGTDYRPWRDWLRGAVTAALPPLTGAEGAGELAGEAGPAVSSSTVPGEAEEYYLQLAVGYSLTGHTSEEVLFYLYGPPRSGKGTFTEALLALFGPEPLAAEVHFGTFVRSRNNDTNSADLARLKPCRLLVSSEPNRDDWLNAGELKRLTGGNLVFAALKYRAHFSYRPTYKLWLAGNHPPQADVDDDALWSRLRVIAFPHSHLGHEDRSLKARMKSPEMQRQILAWAVDGARAWYRTVPRGGLPTPPSIEAATQAARYELDHVGQWLAECVEVTGAEGDFVPNPALQGSYQAWSQQAGAPICSIRRLTQALKAKGLAAGAVRWHAGKSQRGCRGIMLRLHHRAPYP